MTSSTLAPVAVFAYRRLDHLTQTLDALERCPEFAQSPVFVYSDGAKAEAEAREVSAVRSLLRARARPNMKIVEASENKGLAASIISSVTELSEEFGRVVVIEDDLLVAPCTLTWFNTALEEYAASENIFHINAFQHNVPLFRNRREGIFGRFVGSWGWATWHRAWQKFDPTASGWDELVGNASLRNAFDQGGTFPLSDMLIAQMNGKSDSWAVRWFWTVFKSQGLTISPPRSLIRNIGFDQTGTHNSIGVFKRFLAPSQAAQWDLPDPPRLIPIHPVRLEDERAHRKALLRTGAMRNARIKSLLRRAFPGQASEH